MADLFVSYYRHLVSIVENSKTNGSFHDKESIKVFSRKFLHCSQKQIKTKLSNAAMFEAQSLCQTLQQNHCEEDCKLVPLSFSLSFSFSLFAEQPVSGNAKAQLAWLPNSNQEVSIVLEPNPLHLCNSFTTARLMNNDNSPNVLGLLIRSVCFSLTKLDNDRFQPATKAAMSIPTDTQKAHLLPFP